MSRDELLRLAERCEKASGADRHTDLLIARAIGKVPPDANFDQREGDDVAWGGNRLGINVPRYTASLDAAMTLVPEGWSKSITDADDGDAIGELWQSNCNAWSRAKTWPLALTAACLRALAAKKEPSDG